MSYFRHSNETPLKKQCVFPGKLVTRWQLVTFRICRSPMVESPIPHFPSFIIHLPPATCNLLLLKSLSNFSNKRNKGEKIGKSAESRQKLKALCGKKTKN